MHYNILFSIKHFKKFLKARKFSSVTIITSKPIAFRLTEIIDLIKKTVGQKLKIIFLPDGEKAKEWKVVEKLLSDLIRFNVDKRGILIALGGGTVGDVSGFAASIYKRGLPYIQIPTTLVAQIDSALGGKTGINFDGFKNQIGTTYDPIAIVVDIKILKTLNNDQTIDGLGEIIKYGFIKDREIIKQLNKETVSSFLSNKSLGKIIHKSIKVKSFFTTADPYEKGIRQTLNFGHTIGHALELKYNMSHGKAVIEGMIRELAITEKLGLTKKGTKQKLEKLLTHLGIAINKKINPDWHAIVKDKKVFGDKIILPIVKRVGVSSLVTIRLSDFRKLRKRN